METGPTLAGALSERDLRPDDVIRAARFYLAERLHDPATGDVRDHLAERVPDGTELTEVVAHSPRLLLEAALGVLSAAWEEPGDRERIIDALDDHGGKLPAADQLPVAVILVYGLFLLARAGRVTKESTTLTLDGTYEHRTIELRGAFAILLAAITKEPAATTPGPRPDLPGEGNFTVVLLDIHRSAELGESDQARAALDLRDNLSAALADLSVRPFEIVKEDRGDGWRALIPDAAGALTPIVLGLPRLVRKRLGDSPVSGLRVRMGIDCGRLRYDQRWTGAPLVHVARIIDDDTLKERLQESDQRLLTVLSDRVHHETVIAGYAEPSFEPATIAVKRTTAEVWLTMS